MAHEQFAACIEACQQCAIAYAEPDLGLAVAYLTNGLHDPYVVQVRTEEMAWAIREACG